MRVLWVNPSFLDYRIPLYDEMNVLCNGDFHLIYSVSRIPFRCQDKIKTVLGENAHGLEKEKTINIGVKSGFANSGVSIPFPSGLYRKIKEVKPDVILAEGFFQFTPWAVWYSLIHRIPLLIAYERTAHTERSCPLWRRMYRRLIGIFTNGYIANGSLTKEYLMSQGVNEEKIFTGGMCADSKGLAESIETWDKNERKAFRDKLLGTSKGLSYVVVGQMIPRKGVNYILEGFLKHLKMFPDDTLVLVGEGPDLEKFQKQYSKYSSIKFVGGIDYSQIYKYYAVCDVFAIATLEDNWSLVVPEAMACGLPIACSIYNGCYPELVKKGENGITFDPLHLDSVVEALDYFHQVDLNAFGMRSVEIEKAFNPEHTAQNIMMGINYCFKSKDKFV